MTALRKCSSLLTLRPGTPNLANSGHPGEPSSRTHKPRGRPLTSSKTLPVLACLALTIGHLTPAAGQGLRERLTPKLDLPPLDRHHWGVAVLDPAGRLLFGRNADRLFVPASNAKLVVTATATALLNPAGSIRTPVYAGGPIRDGTLAGDLILAGAGDPSWSRRCFGLDTLTPGVCDTDPFGRLRPVASALKRRGIVRIAGAVVGDGSAFESTLTHPTWETDDLIWAYAAPVSALGFNENAVVATVRPGPVGGAATIDLAPDLGALTIDNRVTTVAEGEPTAVTWTRSPDGVTAVATGTIRSGHSGDRSQLAVVDPNRYAALALARVLADSGIVVLGGVSATTDPAANAAARRAAPIAEIESRPIRDWIFPILNVSQNWVAEMLLKQLGLRFGGRGSWQAGLAVERRFLIDSAGVDSTQFILHDGSGLSAKNAVTPLAFARLLGFIRTHPRFPAFAAGMPRSGSMGSLRNRFLGTPVAERVFAKTGSIGQVNSLSGYLFDRNPSRPPCRIFSIQANTHGLGGRTMIQAIDSVVVEIGRLTRCTAGPGGGLPAR